jgi:hypothetical protein
MPELDYHGTKHGYSMGSMLDSRPWLIKMGSCLGRPARSSLEPLDLCYGAAPDHALRKYLSSYQNNMHAIFRQGGTGAGMLRDGVRWSPLRTRCSLDLSALPPVFTTRRLCKGGSKVRSVSYPVFLELWILWCT